MKSSSSSILLANFCVYLLVFNEIGSKDVDYLGVLVLCHTRCVLVIQVDMPME